MTDAGTEPTDEKEENNNAVLSQIGEDPGPSADIIEKDSKRKDIEKAPKWDKVSYRFTRTLRITILVYLYLSSP